MPVIDVGDRGLIIPHVPAHGWIWGCPLIQVVLGPRELGPVLTGSVKVVRGGISSGLGDPGLCSDGRHDVLVMGMDKKVVVPVVV